MTEPLVDAPAISSDLSPLFAPTGPGVRFGQGLITAWNANTGENTVEWAGGTLTDVPILNTGEAVALRAGHVVGMLGQGLTWFIIGRVTPPNDPNFAGASLAFAAKNDQQTGFFITPSLQTKSSVVLDVPPWADEVAIMVTGSCTLVNTNNVVGGGAGLADFASCEAFIDGNPGPSIQQGFAPPNNANNMHIQSMSASSSAVIQPTGSTITCEFKIRVSGGAVNWASHATNIAELSAIAVFRSVT
jgi:hypothetical protein